MNHPKIKIQKNGPYLVTGDVPLSEKNIVSNGRTNEYQPGRELPQAAEYELCRCGHSKNAPFCDGSHKKAHFNGTETASRQTYDDRAEVQPGPGLSMKDDFRCAFARFCHRNGRSVWELLDESNDPKLRDEAIKAAQECPAGRLVAIDTDGKDIEPHFSPSIEILQDSTNNVSGPIFVKGMIPIEAADGHIYEIRNRVTLCRCGESENKPFCDANHIPANYRDHK
ncbi:MAG: CDGSH iron-sulfur domain-containing protein [Firmicutes bacterium]|nr:CDGSH iron-sulfur domain-containing protein [Bacillota bacterium]